MVKILFIINIIIFIIFVALTIYHFKFFSRYKKLKKFLKNYSNVIVSARYGNFNLYSFETCDKTTKTLLKNTKALLESMLDRDNMIKEYVERERETQSIKQDLISSLTHDLKVPIIAQDNTYNLFLEGKLGELTPEQQKIIEILKISNNDLKNLTINLLDVFRLDKAEIELDIEKTNVNDLIKEVIEQNSSILKIKNKEIIFNFEEENIICNLDNFLIKRVLNNLISNAIFYGKDTKNIYIDLIRNKNLEISITDEGEGIKKEEIEQIFKKYYTSAKKYSNIGVGLGLYIVNRIIKTHNGEIKVENKKGKGACFTIVLPI